MKEKMTAEAFDGALQELVPKQAKQLETLWSAKDASDIEGLLSTLMDHLQDRMREPEATHAD